MRSRKAGSDSKGCHGQRNSYKQYFPLMCFDIFVPGLRLYDELNVFLLLTDLIEIHVTWYSASERANAFSVGLCDDW